MVKSEIVIFNISDGSLAVLAPVGAPLRAGQAQVALPADYSDDTHEWSTTKRTMIESLSKTEAKLIAALKGEGEQRKMFILSAGGAKKAEYAAKEREVNTWESLGGGLSAILIAFNAMSADRRATAFPHALADAAAFGDAPQNAIARFKVGIVASGSMPSVCAAEAFACTAIRAAKTVAAKRAAAAAVKWPPIA